jgi:hypothetical protein
MALIPPIHSIYSSYLDNTSMILIFHFRFSAFGSFAVLGLGSSFAGWPQMDGLYSIMSMSSSPTAAGAAGADPPLFCCCALPLLASAAAPLLPPPPPK